MLLKKASEQLAAGADTVNVSHLVKGGELGELARSFDGMAEALVQRETALRESEERWATTLASIGDAVIATGTDGRITFMNTVAEQLTGWTFRDALQKPIGEVFHIINEHTRGEVESPVTKVLHKGMIVGLANHTILMTKDGTEIPIDDSGAPIRDADGKTIGVVLVFRDITDRKQAENNLRESERRERERARSLPRCSRLCPRRYSSLMTPTASTSRATVWRTKYCGFPTATSSRCRGPRKPGRTISGPMKDGHELRLDELPARGLPAASTSGFRVQHCLRRRHNPPRVGLWHTTTG